jgi:hypothetical protein
MSDWFQNWAIWISIAVGLSVSGCIFLVGKRLGSGRRARKAAPARSQEELPWEQLLELMQNRYQEGSAGNEALTADQLMEELLGKLAKNPTAAEEADWSPAPSDDRRHSQRRWSNPVEVKLISPFHDHLVHGLVFNRSTGGLAILADVPFPPDTLLSARPVHAPEGIGYSRIRVRHSRQVSKMCIIGCEYVDETPWNVKVWFG